MSLESLQRDGRTAYDNGDFIKALECFNRAVGRGNPSIKLLDSLAATHIRLNALDAALATAKKTIQTSREDPTGYLRAGQILLKMDKPSTALEIYAYGLKTIKHVGTGFEKLKKAHDELLQQQAPKNSVDPLTVLPRELAIAVLEYLSFRQRIGICRVSKGWTRFVRSEPGLWSHLDLGGAKKKVKTSFVSTAINVARKKITKATLSRLYDFDKVLAALIKHCPLESLTLANTGLQSENLVIGLEKADKLKDFGCSAGTDMNATTLRRILDGCKERLETLKFASDRDKTFDIGVRLPLLKSFEFEALGVLQCWEVLQSLGTHSAGLQSLALRITGNRPGAYFHAGKTMKFPGCANLTHMDLHMPMLSQRDLKPPSTLRVLKLGSSLGTGRNFFLEDGEPMEADDLLMWELPHLEEVHLNFPGLKFHRASIQFNIEPSDKHRNLSMLRSFWIQNAVISSEPQDSFALCGRLVEVQDLGITDCLSLTDEHVETLLDTGKKIEYLNLSGTSITGVAIKSVLQAGHVKRLVANDCTKVGRDAVDWARRQGLQIDFKTTNSLEKGRKVRY